MRQPQADTLSVMREEHSQQLQAVVSMFSEHLARQPHVPAVCMLSACVLRDTCMACVDCTRVLGDTSYAVLH
jgi:hypothetical protein